MKLSSHEEAVIAESKIVNYLLDETHPTGKHKAVFFKRFGFHIDKWTELKIALLQHAAAHEVATTLQTDEGIHYVKANCKHRMDEIHKSERYGQ